MSDFTYEKINTKKMYETYEWDNTWIDHANDTESKRVLYIGDSISCGARRIATAVAKGEILFDGFGTSKSIDNPYLTESVKLFAKQEGKRDVVLFNNGLHGWHLDEKTEYKEHFEKVIKELLEYFSDTPLVIVLTTYITNAEREKRVRERNKAAMEIAKKYNLPVIDLYNVAKESQKHMRCDGVHFLKRGYVKLAKKLVSDVSDIIRS